MFESDENAGSGISNDHAVARMFELVCEGRTDSREYALLDAVIQARLRQTYDNAAGEGGAPAPLQSAA